eukprot:scaffold53_cov193-Pinguiococcus_pyrenoidosus.AAC.29
MGVSGDVWHQTLLDGLRKLTHGFLNLVDVANYGEPRGSEEFRQAIAGVMTKFMLQAEHLSLPESEKPPKKVVVDAEDIVVNAGVSAILHHLSMCLFDEGETILVVAPCYPAFFYDPVVQARLDMVPVVMQPNEAEVSKELLETAMADAKEEGKRVKGIMITTPTNPSGEVLTKDELLTVIDFAERHDLHLIRYEASWRSQGCCFPPRRSTDTFRASRLPLPATSVAHLRPTFGSKIHVIWGLSKDLCASGARVGVLWTQNEAFKVGRWCERIRSLRCQASRLTQLPYMTVERHGQRVDLDVGVQFCTVRLHPLAFERRPHEEVLHLQRRGAPEDVREGDDGAAVHCRVFYACARRHVPVVGSSRTACGSGGRQSRWLDGRRRAYGGALFRMNLGHFVTPQDKLLTPWVLRSGHDQKRRHRLDAGQALPHRLARILPPVLRMEQGGRH